MQTYHWLKSWVVSRPWPISCPSSKSLNPLYERDLNTKTHCLLMTLGESCCFCLRPKSPHNTDQLHLGAPPHSHKVPFLLSPVPSSLPHLQESACLQLSFLSLALDRSWLLSSLSLGHTPIMCITPHQPYSN